jgi:hypothetical protein
MFIPHRLCNSLTRVTRRQRVDEESMSPPVNKICQGLHVKYQTFLSDCIQIWDFLTEYIRWSSYIDLNECSIPNFTTFRLTEAELIHVSRQVRQRDEWTKKLDVVNRFFFTSIKKTPKIKSLFLWNFLFCTPHQTVEATVNRVVWDERRELPHTWRRIEIYEEFWWGTLEDGDHLIYLGADGKIISKGSHITGLGFFRLGSTGSGEKQFVGSCIWCSEHSGPWKCRKFLDHLRNHQIFKWHCTAWN